MCADPLRRGVSALRTGQVYLSPPHLFGWVDFSPKPEAAEVLSSESLSGGSAQEDLRSPVREFCVHFCHRPPSETQPYAALATLACLSPT